MRIACEHWARRRIACASRKLKYDLELPAPTPCRIGSQPSSSAAADRRSYVEAALLRRKNARAHRFGTLQGEYPKALLVLAPRSRNVLMTPLSFIDESQPQIHPAVAIADSRAGTIASHSAVC